MQSPFSTADVRYTESGDLNPVRSVRLPRIPQPSTISAIRERKMLLSNEVGIERSLGSLYAPYLRVFLYECLVALLFEGWLCVMIVNCAAQSFLVKKITILVK